LLDGGENVRGIGVGHRLHHDGCIGADADVADYGGHGLSAGNRSHGNFILSRGEWVFGVVTEFEMPGLPRKAQDFAKWISLPAPQ
jgi:hypothetical protein